MMAMMMPDIVSPIIIFLPVFSLQQPFSPMIECKGAWGETDEVLQRRCHL